MIFFTLVFVLLWVYVMCVGLRKACRSKRGRALAKKVCQPTSSSSELSSSVSASEDELP